MSGSTKVKHESPLCPWIFSGARANAKNDAEGDDSSKSGSGNLVDNDFLTWKDETKSTTSVTPVAQPQNTDSIECVCGTYPNFNFLCDSLRKNNVSFRTDSQEFKSNCQVLPPEIKRISLICCRVNSCKGLPNFPRLKQLFISDGIIPELLWDEFELSHTLQELTVVYSQIKEIEELNFIRLTKLNLWANKLTNLKFLGNGLPSLKTLNVAENRITTLHEENLFKCFNLEVLNISGNPICSLPDIKALKVCHALTNLYLNDALHGDCPIASICSYRHMIITLLENLVFLDGIEIREEDREYVAEYCNQISLNPLLTDSLDSFENGESVAILWENTNADLEVIEKRLCELQVLYVHSNRVIRIMNIVPGMCNYVPCMKKDVLKLEVQMSTLRSLCNKIFKDTSKKLKVGKWENGVQVWLNRLDSDTFGSCRGELLYSSLKCHTIPKQGAAGEKEKVANDFYEFIKASSCQYSLPKKFRVTVESIFILTLHAMELGLQRIYDQLHGESLEPEFVKLQCSQPYFTDYRKTKYGNDNRPKSPNPNRTMAHGFYDNYNREAAKLIQKSFRDANWEPKYEYEFPETIPGLPDPGPVIYLFLICPEYKKETSLEFLHSIMTGNSQCYKNALFTFCAWKAMNRKSSTNDQFSVLIVVKVLKNFLIPVEGDKINEALHHDKICQTYGLEAGITFTPAFVALMSFFPLDKMLYFEDSIDREVVNQTKKRLHKYSAKLGSAMKGRRIRLAKGTMFLNKLEDTIVVADLTSLTSYQKEAPAGVDSAKEDGEEEETCTEEKNSFLEDGNISHFLGEYALTKITKLKLSCNYLTEIVGLYGLRHLRSLDISHNNLTSLECLPILTSVHEFKAQFNDLQSFESCLEILARCFTRLSTVELLPNPFEDIKDWSCLPILVQKKIAKITRVDGWILPFNNTFFLYKIKAPKLPK